MLFMPHTPYVPSGTLREAISFPEDRDVYDDAEVEAAMDKVGLGRLKSRLDTQARWDRLLDTEEQKAVAFAHLLLAKPKWVILDEAMEGLEPEIQAQFSALLTELTDATVIYIGRNEAYLQAMSPRVLHLQALASREDEVAAARAAGGRTRRAAVRVRRRPMLRHVCFGDVHVRPWRRKSRTKQKRPIMATRAFLMQA